MIYYKTYTSVFGEIYLNSDGEYLTALCFKDSVGYLKYIQAETQKELPIFDETVKWLNLYFEGKNPKFMPKYKIDHMTPFAQEVMEELMKIPFGQTTTYHEIADQIAKKRGIQKMSAQAVGKAVGANPIYIMIPCHRVVGVFQNLVGYGGGIKTKFALLKLEGNNMDEFMIPKKGTAL